MTNEIANDKTNNSNSSNDFSNQQQARIQRFKEVSQTD